MRKEKIYVFDAYGTLFDIDSACRNLAKEIGKDWEKLSTMWRQKQLEYSWLRNSMNEYVDFWEITSNALDYAMEVLNIKNIKLRDQLLELYLKLEAYPEVKKVLGKLKDKKFRTGILSNGSRKMLDSAVKNAKIENLLDVVISVEECKIYKPSSKVYDLVEIKTDIHKDKVTFFSSNAWDMHAAANYGFKTIWVNRFQGKLEKLPGKPNAIVTSLDNIDQLI